MTTLSRRHAITPSYGDDIIIACSARPASSARPTRATSPSRRAGRRCPRRRAASPSTSATCSRAGPTVRAAAIRHLPTSQLSILPASPCMACHTEWGARDGHTIRIEAEAPRPLHGRGVMASRPAALEPAPRAHAHRRGVLAAVVAPLDRVLRAGGAPSLPRDDHPTALAQRHAATRHRAIMHVMPSHAR